MSQSQTTRVRFEAQVLPYLDAAYRFARWLGHTPSDAEDIVQEAMLRAYRGFEGLRAADCKAWLLTIVRNCHATACQQQQRRGAMPLLHREDLAESQSVVALAADPERQAMQRDEELTLERLLGHLSAEHREILLLRELDDLSYRDLSRILGVPVGTVMSRLARARAALKSICMTELPGGAHELR